MHRWVGLFLSVVLSILVFTGSGSAQPPTTIADLESGFVEFRVTMERGSGFYDVEIDMEERPYLDVADVFPHWLDMEVNCDLDRQYCQAVMQPSGVIYWIDGLSGLYGHTDGDEQLLPAGGLLPKGGRLWLRHDLWAEWLPINVTWSVWNYTLEFRPTFPLLKELKVQREKSRTLYKTRREQADRIADLPAIGPDRAWNALGRYQLELATGTNGIWVTRGEYSALADIKQGTALISGHSLLSTGNDGGKVDFYRYQQIDQPQYHLLELGHTRYDSGSLISAIDLSAGVRIDRLRRNIGTGLFEYRGHTQPNTEVDVYRNGFLETTLITGDDGLYEVRDLFVSGGDSITFRFFFSDGSEDQKVVPIAHDDGLLLPPGEWDGRLVSGDTQIGRFTHGSVRYGLKHTLSAGLHTYQLPGVTPANSTGFDLSWRPWRGLSMIGEAVKHPYGHDYAAQLLAVPDEHNTLQLEHRRLNPKSLILGLPTQSDRATRLWRLRHTLRVPRWRWQSVLQDSRSEIIASSALDFRPARSMLLRGNLARGWRPGLAQSTAIRLGTVFTPWVETRLEMIRGWDDGIGQWAAKYQLRRRLDGRLDWDWSLQKVDHERTEVATGFTFRINNHLAVTMNANNDHVFLRLTWNDSVIPFPPGPSRYEDFSSGTISGQIMSPGSPGFPPAPMAGVRVRADIQSTVTDEDGRFLLSGQPVNQRIVMTLDRNSMDATYAPSHEAVVFKLRPGTAASHDPELTWTVGVDGVLSIPSLPPETRVQVYMLPNRLVATTTPEPDGFFLIEGLTPGEYRLELIGVDTPPAPLMLNIPDGVDWVPGLTWK